MKTVNAKLANWGSRFQSTTRFEIKFDTGETTAVALFTFIGGFPGVCFLVPISVAMFHVTGWTYINPPSPSIPADFGQKKQRKKSRWSSETPDQKTVIPGMPTVIPPGLTRDQERAYIGKFLIINYLN